MNPIKFLEAIEREQKYYKEEVKKADWLQKKLDENPYAPQTKEIASELSKRYPLMQDQVRLLEAWKDALISEEYTWFDLGNMDNAFEELASPLHGTYERETLPYENCVITYSISEEDPRRQQEVGSVIDIMLFSMRTDKVKVHVASPELPGYCSILICYSKKLNHISYTSKYMTYSLKMPRLDTFEEFIAISNYKDPDIDYDLDELKRYWDQYPYFFGYGFADMLAPGTEESPVTIVNKEKVPEAESVIGINGARIISWMLRTLECNNIQIKTEPAPAKLNKARKKKGQLPYVDRNVICVKVGKELQPLNPQSKRAGGWKVSSHMRRGHVRHLASGKVTWVREARVGRKREVKSKSYQINEASH